MIKIRVALVGVLLLLPLYASAVSFDQNVLKATLQIQIYDDYIKQGVISGTGLVIGGGEILTNYHVAAKVLADPARYRAYGCLTYSLNAEPD